MSNLHIHGSLTYASPARLRAALATFGQHAATEYVDATHWTAQGKALTIDHRCEVPADMEASFHRAFVEAAKTAKAGMVFLSQRAFVGRVGPKGTFCRVRPRPRGRMSTLSCGEVLHDYLIYAGRRGEARVPAEGPPEGTRIIGGHPLVFSAFAAHGGLLAVAVTPRGAPRYHPTAPDVIKPVISDPGNFTVVLYDTESGTEQWRVPVAKYTINALAFSPNGATLAAISTDNTLYRIDTATGASKRIKTGYKGGGQHVAFSNDGTLIATIGEPKRKGFRYKRQPILRIWQHDGTMVYEDDRVPVLHKTLGFSADDTCILLSEGGPIRWKRGGSPAPGPAPAAVWILDAPAGPLRRKG